MSTTSVALLRSVNVAGRRMVKMDALRDAFVAIGFTDVATFIQSGNVLFSSDGPVDADAVESALAAQFGIEIIVAVRTAAELARVVARQPFPDAAKVHVAFLRRPSSATGPPDLERCRPDDAVVDGTEAYLHLPDGIGRSKLPDVLGRWLGVPITIRNWNTVTKLAELAARPPRPAS